MFTPKRSANGGQELSTPQSAGTPQTPRINDDAAERRRRRKSAVERRRSTMVTPHRAPTKTSIFNRSPQMVSPAPFAVQLPRLSPEELNQRYEEWMKIAADNKINANNTWDFALIDYFYDMSLLREGDSINFQKASCTLDGCVKIYSSRVDSVASETGRLLSGLAEAPGGKRGGRRGEDGEEEDGEEEEGGGNGKQKSRRAARSAATLAKDFASISVKKLDLEFSVDPLFKKTSADFDEGGARGLLLNHLCFDADGKIVFDASDSKMAEDNGDDAGEHTEVSEAEDGDDSDVEVASATGKQPVAAAAKQHRATLIDVSSLDAIFGTIAQHLDDAHICPSLADFEFTRDTSLDFSLLKEHLRDDVDEAVTLLGSETNGALSDDQHSDFGGFSGGNDGGGDDGDDMGHFLNFDDVDVGPVPLDTASTLQMTEAEEAEDNGEMATMHHGSRQLAIAEDEDNLLSYFDTKLAKNWAGPEHWRLPISRAIMQKQQQQQQQQQGGGNTGDEDASEEGDASKRKRTEKLVYFTDFMNGSDVSAETLFAKPPRASSTTMSKKAAQNQDHTLPEDVHFSSKNLFNFILKPRLKFNPRRVRSAAAQNGNLGGALESTPGSDAYGAFVVDGDNGGPVFGGMDGNDAQLDDNDRIGFDDVDDYDDDVLPVSSSNEGDSKTDIPQLKLIKPLYVNYARRAKRVNVKKLKDNIWREMASVGGEEGDVMTRAALDSAEAKLESGQKFSAVVSSLKKVYPREKLEELSISYCFICLLHLANERNLRIVGDASLRDLVITQDEFE
ncbi:hypothetical protein GGH94_002373 [Coemansia aciculifera]|uniref:Condensin complex subunit 2 n=1 Tax=Coemansia aciculifera TaxID=417176 RepID=A0A9W8IJK2_9FUNG|nr:hypothetical protein GGH94_002373 [Coemansia aciculifera]KAJ2874564.1 hypothetical protein GGH93_002308 [Coemansia aciculifera]